LDYTKDRDTALQEVEICLRQIGAVKKGDTVVLTSVNQWASLAAPTPSRLFTSNKFPV
jgi:hypothetical protein